jgi:outer membrane protein assembly factor BamD (BamD/ComL family)
VLPTPKVEARTTSASALAAELGALDMARARLASGDPNGALAKLDDYARAYPRGRLVLEAEVVRIDALSRAGQRDQAKKRAEAFLRRHPNSVLAARVRGFLE